MHQIDVFIADVGAARTLAEVIDTLGRELGRLGFEWFTYEMLVPPEGRQYAFHHTTMPAAFVGPYIEQRYTRDDIVLDYALRLVRPSEWREINRHPHLTVPQRNVINVAASAGLRAGGIIPIHGPGPVKAYVGVSNTLLDEEFTRLFSSCRHSLHLVAAYAHERLLELGAGHQAPSLALSPREIEVLTWTALGNSAWEISEKLSISVHTVREYIEQAKRKLRARDKTHAAAIAINQGLIRL